MGDEALLGLFDRIYEAVEQPELWPQTIQAIGHFVGGPPDFWGLSTPDDQMSRVLRESGCWPTFFLSRADLKALDEYEREYGELIIRFLKTVFLGILWAPKNVDTHEAIGLTMTKRYLQVFVRHQGASVSSPDGLARRKLITALWGDGHIFSCDHLRLMRLIASHLDRAVRLQMRLKSADLQVTRVSGALDALTVGVVLIGADGCPLWLNKRAREITSGSNAVRLGSPGLAGHRRSDTQELQDLIKGAVSAGSQGLLAIGREDSRPLLVIAMPLKPAGSAGGSEQAACGVVFISDPDRTDRPAVEYLQQAFDLTYREAQTAIAIANGHGLKAAAQSMGVAVTTARSQLQQAFLKTGTSHQAELAALIHRALTHIRYDSTVQSKQAVCRQDRAVGSKIPVTLPPG
jgi:DNA-binding CsgD family transcriptional regulator